MEDGCCSRQAAKHAKKTMDMTPLRASRLGESPDKLYPGSVLTYRSLGVLGGLARVLTNYIPVLS